MKLAPKGRYTADLYVTFVPSARRRPLVIEYKYQSDLDDDPDLRLKHENLCPVFAQRGEDFEVHTERLVFTPDLNAKKLIWARCNDPASAFDERIVAAVEQRPGVAVGDILAELSNSQEQLRCVPAVWRLVAHRRIFIDFTRQPNRDTALWPEPLPSVRGIAP